MNVLGNRVFAVVMTLVLVSSGTLVGVHRSTGAQGDKIETMFYEGVDGSGYGIAGDLTDRLDYSQYLCKIAAGFSGLDEEISAVQDARLQLDTAGDRHTQYVANQSLTDAVYALDAAMTQAGDASEDWDRYLANFDSAGMTIAHEAEKFNAKVREFNTEILGSFPVSLLRVPAAVDPLEAFA